MKMKPCMVNSFINLFIVMEQKNPNWTPGKLYIQFFDDQFFLSLYDYPILVFHTSHGTPAKQFRTESRKLKKDISFLCKPED